MADGSHSSITDSRNGRYFYIKGKPRIDNSTRFLLSYTMKRFKGRGFLQITGRNMAISKAFSASPTITSIPNLTTVNLAQSGSGLVAKQLNTISLSNLGNVSASYTNDWLSDLNTSNPLVKKYEVFESTEDLIACAVTAHRIKKETTAHYKLLDRELFNKITPDDRTKADLIKDYYSKKIMMWKLKGAGRMSPFREDMNKLIHSDCLTFRENMIGVAYWLPEFYEYDTNMDEVKSQVDINQGFIQMDKDNKPRTLRLSVDLEPIKKVQHNTKRLKTTQYWFKDTKLNSAVTLTVESDNQLKHLWDYMYDTEKVLKIGGQYYRRHQDDFEYYSITNWQIDRT